MYKSLMGDAFYNDIQQIKSGIAQVLRILAVIQKQESTMTAQLQALTNQVAANTTVETSAVTLIQQLAALIQSSVNDPAALTALTTQLQSSATALAAAITANTPAAPTP